MWLFPFQLPRRRTQIETRTKQHIEFASSINLFDDQFQKNLHGTRDRARTSNVTSSNGPSSSVIAPSRERLRPARFTARPQRSTSRAAPPAAKVKRAVSRVGDAL